MSRELRCDVGTIRIMADLHSLQSIHEHTRLICRWRWTAWNQGRYSSISQATDPMHYKTYRNNLIRRFIDLVESIVYT